MTGTTLCVLQQALIMKLFSDLPVPRQSHPKRRSSSRHGLSLVKAFVYRPFPPAPPTCLTTRPATSWSTTLHTRWVNYFWPWISVFESDTFPCLATRSICDVVTKHVTTPPPPCGDWFLYNNGHRKRTSSPNGIVILMNAASSSGVNRAHSCVMGTHSQRRCQYVCNMHPQWGS